MDNSVEKQKSINNLLFRLQLSLNPKAVRKSRIPKVPVSAKSGTEIILERMTNSCSFTTPVKQK